MLVIYEYHGWITIRATANCDDEPDDAQAAQAVSAYIDSLDWPYVLGMKPVNGSYHLWISGNPNHKPRGDSDPLEFFRQIGRLAPGSYGLLHVWDDEGPNGTSNAFRAFALTRGELKEHKDPFLSPCIPAIEDPCT